MDIRYIYMRRNDAEIGESPWLKSSEPDNVRLRALSHASEVVRCPVLVVERDASTGFMVPLGLAAAFG